MGIAFAAYRKYRNMQAATRRVVPERALSLSQPFDVCVCVCTASIKIN